MIDSERMKRLVDNLNHSLRETDALPKSRHSMAKTLAVFCFSLKKGLNKGNRIPDNLHHPESFDDPFTDQTASESNLIVHNLLNGSLNQI